MGMAETGNIEGVSRQQTVEQKPAAILHADLLR